MQPLFGAPEVSGFLCRGRRNQHCQLFYFSTFSPILSSQERFGHGKVGLVGLGDHLIHPLIPFPADYITLTLMEVPKIHLQHGSHALSILLFTLSIKSLS